MNIFKQYYHFFYHYLLSEATSLITTGVYLPIYCQLLCFGLIYIKHKFGGKFTVEMKFLSIFQELRFSLVFLELLLVLFTLFLSF